MKTIRKFIARLFGIKTEVYTLRDEPISDESYKIISTFLQTKVGAQLCDYLASQKFAVASKAARHMRNGDLWQGYAIGFEDAINSLLAFRQSDVNDDSGASREVGLETLAEKLDQMER